MTYSGRFSESSPARTELDEVVAFIGVTSLDEAEQFYGRILGLTLSDERPFALTASLGATRLRITEVGQVHPASYTVVGFTVSDIAAAVAALSGRGLAFTRYEGMQQERNGVWTSPSGARVAWFVDPDGNNLSLTQHP
jgi:catechol 2,3-dioxygenase-like lactoylglutathione lyase family enzyme